MSRVLNSFKIRSGNRLRDYRLGKKLNLSQIKSFFQDSYQVEKLWSETRHILGILRKNGRTYFLKLSTSEGMSVVTKNEYDWNNYFHSYFPTNLPFTVPKNYDSGAYQGKYFYLVTDYFSGELLCTVNAADQDISYIKDYIPSIILLSEAIQKLPVIMFTGKDKEDNYQAKFINKVNVWFGDIPINIRKKFALEQVLRLIEEGIDKLFSRPRHGDFTPWHIVKLADSKLGLIDGEHALVDSVENYDICYFIQRVFSVLKNPVIAQEIYSQLLLKGYQAEKMRIVLAARTIGGFLDESLSNNPDYQLATSFKDWVLGT